MTSIYCPITFIPIRLEPSHKSEQVSQLIFGETAKIISSNEEWYQITTNFDSYTGWLERKTVILCDENIPKDVIVKPFFAINANTQTIFIPEGAEIHAENQSKLFFNEKPIFYLKNEICKPVFLQEVIEPFIGTPYLWGGRTSYGIDCSGFSQIIMKCLGTNLPRDASQQFKCGTSVESVSKARKGDLAFFKNNIGSITHVGIIIDRNKIVHASGNVRIDILDDAGIYIKNECNYSHKLAGIRRILASQNEKQQD